MRLNKTDLRILNAAMAVYLHHVDLPPPPWESVFATKQKIVDALNPKSKASSKAKVKRKG